MAYKDILWGSSTNAQQFEGGYADGGKGLTIADVRKIKMDTITESNFDSFKVAADHYHHMEEDIQYYGEMGFEIYRFTMSWARIFPNGNDEKPNQEGLDFYDRMLTELEKYKIQPVCTLYAYDLPLNLLKEYNGWMSRECIEDYLKYVKTVVSYFKGRVKYWLPFNEQNFLAIDSEYMTGTKAKDDFEIFTMEHHFNLAYAQATKLIHECDPQAKTGGNIGNCCFIPATCNPVNVQAADELNYRFGYNFADVYCKGIYTKRYLNLYKDLDTHQIILAGDLEKISQAQPDFISLTYYMTSTVDATDGSSGINMIKGKNPFVKQTDWGWNIDPYGFRHMIEEFSHRTQMPIVITENGMGAYDKVEDDGTINDDYRIDYLNAHIKQLKDAVDNGADVKAYMTWSATDLYSTREGLVKRYGFVHVDENTLERKPKKSFYWYKKFIASKGDEL